MTLPRIEEPRFGTAEVVRLSGVPDKTLRNWIDRRILDVSARHFTGRLLFSLLDVFHVAAMHDLNSRAGVAPAEAADIATVVVSEIHKRAVRDAVGQLTLEPSTIPRSLALAAARVDGEMMVGLIDPAQPEYMDFRGHYGRTHLVVPLAGLVADVMYRSVSAR